MKICLERGDLAMGKRPPQESKSFPGEVRVIFGLSIA
jgi:hypothetical protein